MRVGMEEKILTGRTVLFSILVFFGLVIAVNVTMMTLAVETLPGTDVDNPYSTGLAYNKEISAARAQEARAWHVMARVERQADGQSTIRVEARDGAGAPVTGIAFFARLEHPVDRRADHAVSLSEGERGIYGGTAENVAAGQWELVIDGERGSRRMFMSRNRLLLR
jgi:nitrogen fixation protein FixH